MVVADLNDEASLKQAFEQASAIFAFTDYYETSFTPGPERSMDMETEQGRRIARVVSTIKSLEC